MRHEEENLIVDTCLASDGYQPFEPGVSHPDYNNGEWVIVEAYDSEEDSIVGHNKWVGIMTDDELPEILRDCVNCPLASLLPEEDRVFHRENRG